MILAGQGSLLDSTAEALVNPVNCVGVMGKGLALSFKLRWPEMYDDYREACRKERMRIGVIHAYWVVDGPWILNFPTKSHWDERSELSHVEAGLFTLVQVTQDLGLQSIAIPALGCGLGGLDWGDVKPLIVRAFEPLPDVNVHLWGPW